MNINKQDIILIQSNTWLISKLLAENANIYTLLYN